MRRALALALLTAFAFSCEREPEVGRARYPNVRPLDAKPPDDSADRVSIVSIARGSVITSRTGEALLELSALRATDGDPVSAWTSPPQDLPQSMTIALAARTRIERVGFRTNVAIPVRTVAIEGSTDGITFAPIKSVVSAETRDAQWFDIQPVEVMHLRYSMVDAPRPDADARIASVLAQGAELEPPRPGDATGCWNVNGVRTRLERKGTHVTGIAQTGKEPMHFSGGFDGRTYRLSWIRGNDYGYLFMAVSPDGRSMNAIEWHEEAIPLFFGESWFGTRTPCSSRETFDAETPEKLLRRTGRYSLFGLSFNDDGSVDTERSAATIAWLVRFLATAPQSRFVGHEYRRANPQENKAFAQRELDALRAALQKAGAKLDGVAFVAQGSDAPRQPPENDPMRSIYSTIDLETKQVVK